MIERAIIEELVDDYSARIRIPRWDKLSTSAHGTPTKDLSIAHYCAMPGCKPHYVVGDVVYVMFERESMSLPIVIGLLYRNADSKSTMDIRAESLIVNVNTQLSSETSIGNVTKENISNVGGLVNSAQTQINLLSERIKKLEDE